MLKIQEILKDAVVGKDQRSTVLENRIYINETDSPVFDINIDVISVDDPDRKMDVSFEITAEDIFCGLTDLGDGEMYPTTDRDEIIEYLYKDVDIAEMYDCEETIQDIKDNGGTVQYFIDGADRLPDSVKDYRQSDDDLGLQDNYKQWVLDNAMKFFDADNEKVDDILEEYDAELREVADMLGGNVKHRVIF